MTQESIYNFCTNCGAKLRPNAKFCINCGTKINYNFNSSQKSKELSNKNSKENNNFSNNFQSSTDNNHNLIESKCPFCGNMMRINEENGFLGTKTVLNCDSCHKIFEKKGNLFSLKNPEDKNYLIKYKGSKLPWHEWILIGQKKYTQQETQEEQELKLVETTDVNCPTCNTPFKKYLGEGLLSHYQFICPTCKARYEYDGSYKFMNIPDTNSKLWEHYQEKMTMMGYTIILNKKYLDKTNEYECNYFETDINESYPHLNNSFGKTKSKLIVYDDNLEIKTSEDNKIIYYNQISNINGYATYIELIVGAKRIFLSNNERETEYIYKKFRESYDKYNTERNKQTKSEDTIYSDADELMKWHQMMEQGIITEEEFEHKKKELIGL